MPRYYLKFLGGAAKVDDLVGLAPSNHGTENPGALVAGATFCPACDQQRAGSAFLAQPQRRRRDPRRRLLHRRSRPATTRSSPRTRRPSWRPAPARPTSCSRTPARPRSSTTTRCPTTGSRSAGRCRRSNAPARPTRPSRPAASEQWTSPAGWLARGARRVLVLPGSAPSERAPERARGRCAAASAGPWAGTSSSRPGASSWPAAARRGRASRRSGSPPTGRRPSS